MSFLQALCDDELSCNAPFLAALVVVLVIHDASPNRCAKGTDKTELGTVDKVAEGELHRQKWI